MPLYRVTTWFPFSPYYAFGFRSDNAKIKVDSQSKAKVFAEHEAFLPRSDCGIAVPPFKRPSELFQLRGLSLYP